MDERRNNPRLAINKDAYLSIGDYPRPIPCTVEDISAGGMKVSLGRYLSPEVFSNVNVALTDNFNFDAAASVMWQESAESKNTYGLSFARIEEADKKRIAQLVSSSLEEEGASNWWRGI